jgi:hypothetical protein
MVYFSYTSPHIFYENLFRGSRIPRAGLLTIAPCKDANALIIIIIIIIIKKKAKLPLITRLYGVLCTHRGNWPQPLMEEKVQNF